MRWTMDGWLELARPWYHQARLTPPSRSGGRGGRAVDDGWLAGAGQALVAPTGGSQTGPPSRSGGRGGSGSQTVDSRLLTLDSRRTLDTH